MELIFLITAVLCLHPFSCHICVYMYIHVCKLVCQYLFSMCTYPCVSVQAFLAYTVHTCVFALSAVCYSQVLTVGPHAGKKVQEAKKVIQRDMVASGEAVLYQEPERTVITRSGDQCVVALTDQW